MRPMSVGPSIKMLVLSLRLSAVNMHEWPHEVRVRLGLGVHESPSSVAQTRRGCLATSEPKDRGAHVVILVTSSCMLAMPGSLAAGWFNGSRPARILWDHPVNLFWFLEQGCCSVGIPPQPLVGLQRARQHRHLLPRVLRLGELHEVVMRTDQVAWLIQIFQIMMRKRVRKWWLFVCWRKISLISYNVQFIGNLVRRSKYTPCVNEKLHCEGGRSKWAATVGGEGFMTALFSKIIVILSPHTAIPIRSCDIPS